MKLLYCYEASRGNKKTPASIYRGVDPIVDPDYEKTNCYLTNKQVLRKQRRRSREAGIVQGRKIHQVVKDTMDG